VRKAVVLFLLGSFILNTLGFVKVFQLYHSKAGSFKKVVHYQRLRKEKSLVIILPQKDVKLTDRGFKRITNSEYVYKGKHYDVVKRKITKKRRKIYLKHDVEEETLLAFLHSFFDSVPPIHSSKKQPRKTLKFSVVKLFIVNNFRIIKTRFPSKYIAIIQSCTLGEPYQPVHLPPPKLV
jgi:hypothetical protein